MPRFRESAFSRSCPFDLETKQTGPSRDAAKNTDMISTHSSIPSQFRPIGQTHSTHIGSRKNQYQESTTVLPDHPFASKPHEAASSEPAREAGLAASLFRQSSHGDGGLPPSRQACLSNETVHSQRSLDTRRLSYGQLAILRRESDRTINAPRPDMLVCTVEKDATQFTSANRAERPSPLYSESEQLRTQVSSPATGYGSPPPMFSNVPLPEMKIHSAETMDDKDGSHISPPASSLTARYTPSLSATIQTSVEEDSDDYYQSSPPITEESSSEDNSCSPGVASPSPHGGHRSFSTDMIRYPSPGSLTVIWKWVITKNREKMLPTFYWIVRSLCPNLNLKERKEGYIYAFRCEQPEGRNYLKIGCTDRVDNRIAQHERCYGHIEQIYPQQGVVKRNIRHMHRVERLIHAELVQQSMMLQGCPQMRVKHECHGEWFDIDDRHAIKVIERWSDWIMTAPPYKEVPSTPKAPRKPQDTKKKELTPTKKEPAPTKKKKPEATVWQLWAREQESIMEMCWPLDMSATMMDDDWHHQ